MLLTADAPALSAFSLIRILRRLLATSKTHHKRVKYRSQGHTGVGGRQGLARRGVHTPTAGFPCGLNAPTHITRTASLSQRRVRVLPCYWRRRLSDRPSPFDTVFTSVHSSCALLRQPGLALQRALSHLTSPFGPPVRCPQGA